MRPISSNLLEQFVTENHTAPPFEVGTSALRQSWCISRLPRTIIAGYNLISELAADKTPFDAV